MINRLTQETKTQIAKQYLAGRYNEDIMRDFKITKNELYDVLAELKIPRKSVAVRKKYKKIKTCRSCGQPIEVKNAKFCPHCGERILTAEICIDILCRLKGLVDYIPAGEDKQYVADIEIIENFINECERGNK